MWSASHRGGYAALNIVVRKAWSQILSHVPYEALAAGKVVLPKRKIGRYESVDQAL
jgi:hypothetical protein